MKYTSYILLFIFFAAISVNGKNLNNKNVRKIQVRASADQPMLGLLIQNQEKNSTSEKGVVVVSVVDDSPAKQAGIKKNDRISKVDGLQIIDAGQLNEISEKWKENQEIKIVLQRGDKTLNFNLKTKVLKNPTAMVVKVSTDDEDLDRDEDDDNNVTVDVRSGDDDDSRYTVIKDVEKVKVPGVSWSSSNEKGGYLGVDGKTLQGQLKDYFKVKQGVLIENVVKDSPAEKAGLKAGDVIVKIERRDVADFEDLVRILNFYNPDEKIQLDFVRRGDKKSVKVQLAKKKYSNAYFFSNDKNGIHKDLNEMYLKLPKVHGRLKELRGRLKGLKWTEEVQFYLI